MNTNSQIRSLTWKYFFQQKWDEITPSILVIFLICSVWLIPFLIHAISPSARDAILDSVLYAEDLKGLLSQGEFISNIVCGLIMILYGLVLLLAFVIIYGVGYWLQENYSEAQKRAIKEFKARKTKR